jgi:chromosome segregation protein
VRQAHYAAGDQVNQAQGLLYEASAEVGRLEAEIRFVVEGRQRVEQRLAQLKEQAAQWATRKDDAAAEIETLAEQAVLRPKSRPNCWPPRWKSRPSSCPSWKSRCARRRPGQRAARQRGPGAAADPGAGRRAAQHRRAVAPAQPAPRTPGGRPQRAGRAGRSPAGQPAAQLERRTGSPARTPKPACRSCRSRCRSWTKSAAPSSRPSTPNRAKQADLSARMEALKALQEKVKTDGKLQALAGQARAGRVAGPVEPHPHRAGLGKRAGSGAARAPGRAGSVAAGHGARLCTDGRRAAGQAGVLQPAQAAAHPRQIQYGACRAWPICCA